ncbi:hypothetical protein ACR6C2_25115 [Streptomyces sp. INA 01156]
MWLKLTPESALAREEAEALRAWAGTPSVVTLLAEDVAAGALLLEHVEPGVPVRQQGWIRRGRGSAARPEGPASPAGGVFGTAASRTGSAFCSTWPTAGRR